MTGTPPAATAAPAARKRFRPHIEREQCKGCGRCVAACPRRILAMDPILNQMGFPTAVVAGDGCVGCGACFYTCPEPGAVTVFEEDGE